MNWWFTSTQDTSLQFYHARYFNFAGWVPKANLFKNVDTWWYIYLPTPYVLTTHHTHNNTITPRSPPWFPIQQYTHDDKITYRALRRHAGWTANLVLTRNRKCAITKHLKNHAENGIAICTP